jgi:hypothetical protein
MVIFPFFKEIKDERIFFKRWEKESVRKIGKRKKFTIKVGHKTDKRVVGLNSETVT